MKTFAELMNPSTRNYYNDGEPWWVIYEYPMTMLDGKTLGEVTLNENDCRPVELWYALSVMVMGGYHDPSEWLEGALDLDGNCMVRVPMEAIIGFISESEAEQWHKMKATDEQMLRNAY